VALHDEDGNKIPKQFLAYWERWHLDYKHSPSGIALILGVVSLPVAVMLLLVDVTGDDRRLGTILLLIACTLLIASRALYVRQDRGFQRRMAAYEEWKRGTTPTPPPSATEAAE